MKFTPFRIAVIYFLFALAWILGTDSLAGWLISDTRMLNQIQTIKGVLYISLTALGLYLMNRSYEKYISRDKDKLEEISRSLNLALSSANMATWEYIVQKNQFITSENYNRLMGLDSNAENNLESTLNVICPEDVEDVMDILNKTFYEGGNYEIEYRILGDDNKISWIRSKGIAYKKNGSVTDVSGVVVDVTSQKKLEQKLKQSNERLHLTTTSANVGLWEWYPQTGQTEFDEMWTNLVGYTRKELEPISIETWNRLVHPHDLEHFEETVEKYFQGELPNYECEVRMKHKNGHWVWILDRGKTVEWDDAGKPVRMVGTHIDITERKKAEEIRKYNSMLLENVSEAVIAMDEDFKITTWNDRAEELYGWKSDEVKGKQIQSLIETEYSDTTSQEAMERLMNEGLWKGEVVQKGKDGSKISILSSVKVIKDQNGVVKGMLALNRDITELKKQQIQLLRLSESLSKALDAAKMATWDIDLQTDQMVTSSNHPAILGAEPSDKTRSSSYLELIVESDIPAIEKAFENTIENHEKFEVEFRVRGDDHKTRWFSSTGQVQLGDDGKTATGISGVVRDITELKEIEARLQIEQERFKISANITSDVIWEWNPVEKKLWWGEGIETVFGYKPSDYEGDLHFWKEHISEQDRERVTASMEKAENSQKEYWTEEYSFIAADGTLKYVNDSAILMRNDAGKLMRVIGAMVDVTDIKRYQKELKQQSYRFEMIAKSSSDVMYEWDIRTGKVWWSEGWQIHFEIPKNRVENNSDWWEQRIHPDDRLHVLHTLEESVNTGKSAWKAQYRFLNGKGEYSTVIDKGYYIKNPDGENEYLMGTISDITSDVEAEEQLKASEEQYRLLFEQSPIPMWIFDPETFRFVAANNIAVEKYGYSESEIKKMKIFDLHPEVDVEAVKKEAEKDLKLEKTGFDVWVHQTKSGEKLIVEISGSRIYYNGSVHRLIIANDITEKREVEEKLRASEEQYRLLFDQNPIPMWIYDPDTLRFSTTNQAARKKYGYTREEFSEMTILDIRPENDREAVKEDVKKWRRGEAVSFSEWVHITKQGEKLIVEISASNIIYEGHSQRLIIANDITSQRRAEERAISAIIEGEERERQRIAKELHDGLGQYLSAANMNLETVYEDLEGLEGKLKKSYKTGLELLKQSIIETRTISQNLLPKAIQDYGLGLAVESLINQLRNTNPDIQFYLYRNLGEASIPDKVQINLYRIAQEALSNAIRHGKPENIDLQLIWSDDEILLTVEDNGMGFDKEKSDGKGLGLRSMKTRVGAMSANLDIVSTLGRGTIVSAAVPQKYRD